MPTVFVTVGSTSFDLLITEVNKPEFHYSLFELGYRSLIVQYGDGLVIPKVSEDFDKDRTLSLKAFRFNDNLDEQFNSSFLVISHAGSGSCIQALTPPGCRKLIVVINESLMDNHQEELASILAQRKHALITTPSLLINFLLTGEQIYLPVLNSNKVCHF